jgi:hypothetical protein
MDTNNTVVPTNTSLIGKRKLYGALLLFLASLVLCYTGKVTGDAVLNYWIFLYGIFVGGNVGSKVLEYYNSKNNNASTGV